MRSPGDGCCARWQGVGCPRWERGLKGRRRGAAGGTLAIADDLAANTAYADKVSADIRREIDDYIARQGPDAEHATAPLQVGGRWGSSVSVVRTEATSDTMEETE